MEREVEARRRGVPAPPSPQTGVDTTLLTALELAVAGLSREEIRGELGNGAEALDAVFGPGSPPQARLTRRRGQ